MTNKRIITLTLVAITLALAGSVLIQLQWVRGILDLRKAQMEQSIDDALVDVSERLDRMEALRRIRQHEWGSLLLDEGEAVPERDEAAFSAPGESPALEQRTVEEELRERLVGDMVRGILGAGAPRDPQELIDPHLLDSLLSEELQGHGILADHQFGVLDEEGDLLLIWPPAADADRLKESTHRTRLFRADPLAALLWLHVVVPDQHVHVRRSMWGMLALSLFFTLLIIIAFAYTIRTILWQKRISDIRTDLVNNLTHELKTPISTIALAAEALNDPGMTRTPEQDRAFLGMIRDETKRLGMLVEKVLQSAVLDSGSMVIKPVDIDLHALLDDVVRHGHIQAERRQGAVVLQPGAELFHVQGDRIHLTNVFSNLIDNALKYCDREPRVNVITSSDHRGVTIRVTDNGIGIARAEQERIFERLYRVPTGNVHNVKGFGLGLSYVKAVVERHHGQIHVESEPGRGSTFIIELPFEHGAQG
ncbi:MAG: HAMP domain-containing histidine kinase [Flavobacteriales bacterium]|nr:HAMP domain-containing histidine kinase [Flavobacteriales bacterium]